MGQVESVGVDLHFGQRVEVHNLIIEAVQIEFACTLLDNAPILELDCRFNDRLLHKGAILNRLSVLSSVLFFDC